MKIKVKVFPNSKKNRITKKSNDNYDLEMKEEPKRGKANEALVDLFSQYFNISKKRIRIIKGWKQRNKIIKIKKKNAKTK